MNRPVLFILLMLFWVILTWPLELSTAYWQDLSVGAIACLIVTWIMGERTGDVRHWLQPRRLDTGSSRDQCRKSPCPPRPRLTRRISCVVRTS